MAAVRVLIADDHSILRAGLRSILDKMPNVDVVGEAADGRAALAQLPTARPDVVLMDIAMKGLNGLETTGRIAKEFPGIRVLILSMHVSEEFVWQAMHAGAVGYLLKDALPEEIELALDAAMRGETYLTSAISPMVIANYIRNSGNEASSVHLLTPRQREILQLLAEGKSTKEIARLLAISAKTVETHRTQIMVRLDIHDVPGLVRYAIRVGLVQSDR